MAPVQHFDGFAEIGQEHHKLYDGGNQNGHRQKEGDNKIGFAERKDGADKFQDNSGKKDAENQFAEFSAFLYHCRIL
jgi:hypothetical protein